MTSIVSVAEAKTHLNIPAATTTWDTELQGFCDAVQTVVEDIAGPVTQRTITNEVHDGGGYTVALLNAPVVSITSVKEYVGTSAFTLTSQPLGSTVDNYGYELTDQAGAVLTRRGAAGVPMPFQGGRDAVVVSYVAGYAAVPANVRLGALELVRHWWQRSQQGGRPGFTATGGTEGAVQVGAYLVPFFVAELLAATPTAPRRVPGIA